MDNNQFSGTMPIEVCRNTSGRLDVLTTDCLGAPNRPSPPLVTCNCCTQCFQLHQPCSIKYLCVHTSLNFWHKKQVPRFKIHRTVYNIERLRAMQHKDLCVLRLLKRLRPPLAKLILLLGKKSHTGDALRNLCFMTPCNPYCYCDQ